MELRRMRAKEFLSEGLDPVKTETILKNFILFAKDKIGLESLPKINFIKGSERSVEHHSFGGYGNNMINITVSNRHINDVCRTLAHELVHYKQDIHNELDDNAGDTGSPQENEANAYAAVIMREWGRMHPQLFAELPVE